MTNNFSGVTDRSNVGTPLCAISSTSQVRKKWRHFHEVLSWLAILFDDVSPMHLKFRIVIKKNFIWFGVGRTAQGRKSTPRAVPGKTPPQFPHLMYMHRRESAVIQIGNNNLINASDGGAPGRVVGELLI